MRETNDRCTVFDIAKKFVVYKKSAYKENLLSTFILFSFVVARIYTSKAQVRDLYNNSTLPISSRGPQDTTSYRESLRTLVIQFRRYFDVSHGCPYHSKLRWWYRSSRLSLLSNHTLLGGKKDVRVLSGAISHIRYSDNTRASFIF